MSDGLALFAIFGPSTCILLLAVVMIIHDKIVEKRCQREIADERATTETLSISDKERALKILRRMPSSASYDKILNEIRLSWAEDIPKPVRDKAEVIFKDDRKAALWLTRRHSHLNGAIPAEIARIPEGAEVVLQILEKMGESEGAST